MRFWQLASLGVALIPALVGAADIRIDGGGITIQSGQPAAGAPLVFGSRDHRGYYWDGEQYRDPRYWNEHNGPKGERAYTGRRNNAAPKQGGGHCPPGQAKKGNC